MIIINFSYAHKDIAGVISGMQEKDIPQIDILDFTSVVPRHQARKVYYPTDLDPDGHIHKAAISEYIHQMGLLSRAVDKNNGETIRSIRVLELSLFWLTRISQKNPQDSVLKNFYYFKHLVHKLSLTNKKVIVVLPQICANFQSVLTTFLLLQNIKKEHLQFNSKIKANYSFRIFLSYIRAFYKKIRQTRNYTKRNTGEPTLVNDLIFTSYPSGWKEDKKGDIVLSDIERLSLEKHRSPKYCPVFFSYESLPGFKSDEKFDLGYFAFFPSELQVMRLFKDLLRAYRRIINLDLDLEQITFVDNTALRYEFLDVLHHKLEYFCNYLWLRNYFDKDDRSYKVFYQDEFFSTGRLISEAVRNSKNNNIQSYGVQHGLFYEAHTVYFLTDAEIDNFRGDTGLPMPGKFIVWGEYFRNLFLSCNSLPGSYVIPAGNLAYIYRSRADGPPETKERSGKGPRLLWCNTLEVDAIRVYSNILRDFVKAHPEVEVEIRFHPIVNLRKMFEEQLLDADIRHRFTYSEHKTIFDAIRNSDVVLTNSGSTVFLDGLVAGKPIFHFVNNDYYMGSLGKDEMRHIYKLEDMNLAYANYKGGSGTTGGDGRILILDMNEWESVLDN